jgi:hypothetical protein
MPTLQDTEILDLVEGTLYNLGPPRFQQIAQEIQGYEVMSKWLKKDKVTEDHGIGIQRALMTKLAGAARHIGLAEVDNVDVADLMDNVQIPWRHAETHWAFERREALMNRGKALIFKIIKPRRCGAMIDLAAELEEKAWASPGASNTTDPYGIPYWVVSNSSTGFNGGAPSGHTTVGGINPTTETKWKNYTGTFAAVTKTDLVAKLRTAHRKIRWRSPVNIQEFRSGRSGGRLRLYTDEANIQDFEDIGEAQNENLGRDIASMDETITFRKHPIIWVPYLDDNSPVSSNPVYMIDHAVFFPVVLAGDFLRESKPAIKADQHNVFVVFVDLSYNFLCIDRRRNAVLYKA